LTNFICQIGLFVLLDLYPVRRKHLQRVRKCVDPCYLLHREWVSRFHLSIHTSVILMLLCHFRLAERAIIDFLSETQAFCAKNSIYANIAQQLILQLLHFTNVTWFNALVGRGAATLCTSNRVPTLSLLPNLLSLTTNKRDFSCCSRYRL